MRMRKTLLSAGVLIGLLAIGHTGAHAQVAVGAEALFGSDKDFGIGGRIHVPLGTSLPMEFQGSFDLFFPDGPQEYWEINGNLLYLFELVEAPTTVPYAGGGFNIGRESTLGISEPELGVNFVGGVRFELASTTPFLEARILWGGAGQFVIGGGFLFGGF